MTTLLKEQAWQSGLVLSDETPEWNQNDWPPLVGGWRAGHTSVVLDHPDTDGNDNNNKRQTVVVLGGYQAGQGSLDSILVLNVAAPDKYWREGPSMNKSRRGHAAVGCNGGVYVMGGFNEEPESFDCIEQIDADEILQSSSTSSSAHERNWTTLTCRLSTRRSRCCAVAVHNRYIVVIGGFNSRYLSSVDIIDTSNHIVTAGPSMTFPRASCASVVIGHRIFVVGGENDLKSVEYLEFSKPGDNEETKKQIGLTLSSFSSPWMTHADLVLSNARSSCAVVAMGSCLVVAGGWSNSTVEVLDTHHNRVWNLPPFGNDYNGCNMVTVLNQVAVIGGWYESSCVTLPLMDKNTWCFRRLCEQHLNRWHHFREGLGIGDDPQPDPHLWGASATNNAEDISRLDPTRFHSLFSCSSVGTISQPPPPSSVSSLHSISVLRRWGLLGPPLNDPWRLFLFWWLLWLVLADRDDVVEVTLRRL